MATSTTEIANIALQKLGVGSISDLGQDHSGAKAVLKCYTAMRDLELSKHNWRFAVARVQLAASVTAPAFDYARAFPIPSDWLRTILPATTDLDWSLENHGGVRAILTNVNELKLVYVKRVTDVTLFHPTFDEALACRIAHQVCEEATGSNTKKAAAADEYKDAIAEAKKANAFFIPPRDAAPDTWVQIIEQS